MILKNKDTASQRILLTRVSLFWLLPLLKTVGALGFATSLDGEPKPFTLSKLSGRWDLNPGPLAPKASALAGLRYAPFKAG